MATALATTITPRGAHEWLVTSRTTPGAAYLVRRVHGQWSCDCDGNYHRGRCWHVTAAQDVARSETWRQTRDRQMANADPMAEELATLFITGRWPS